MDIENVTIEEVQRLASILCLDVPQGTEFGVDFHQWTVGPKFKGVKMITPGVHFVYYNATSKYGDTAPTTSFFVFLHSGEVIVRRWNPSTEDFDELDTDEADRYIGGVQRMEFDQYLGPYPKEKLNDWLVMSKHITEDVNDKLSPIGKKISSIYEDKEQKKKDAKDVKMEEIDENKTTFKSHVPYYSDVPTKKSPPPRGSTPSEVTKFGLDKSSVLYELMSRYKERFGLLGELQYSFITFLLGADFEGFEQWKGLVSLIASCDEAMLKMPDFYIEFINVVQFQFKQVPEDFFQDIISGENFLFVTLKTFFELLNDQKMDMKLLLTAQKLKQYIERRFKISFEASQDDEDAPVVVEM